MNLQPLYNISQLEFGKGVFSAEVTFNPSNEVFAGHFPGQPVVPGVFLINITKEIAGKILNPGIQLLKGMNIKFLHMIDPRKYNSLSIKGSYIPEDVNMLIINAVIYTDELTFFKFKGRFTTKTLKP